MSKAITISKLILFRAKDIIQNKTVVHSACSTEHAVCSVLLIFFTRRTTTRPLWPQWQLLVLCPVIYMQNVITTMTWTEVNYPQCLPVSQFDTSSLRSSDPDVADWNQVTQPLSPLRHYTDISSIWTPAAGPCSSQQTCKHISFRSLSDQRSAHGSERVSFFGLAFFWICSPMCWVLIMSYKTLVAAVDILGLMLFLCSLRRVEFWSPFKHCLSHLASRL